MKRPVGVILTAIVLGLCAGFQLLTAALVAIGAFAVRHLPTAPPAAVPGYPNPAMPPPGFITIFLIAYAVFLIALAGWAIVTLVGLVRMKNWARYSVLVIGGCMAALSLMMVFGAIMGATVMPATASTAKLPPHTMQAVFLFEGLIFAIFAGISVSWLVYFNLRTIKAYFIPAFPMGYEPAYVLDPTTFPALPGAPPPPLYPPFAAYPAPGRLSNVPTPVVVIAILSLLGGAITVVSMFLPFPGFIAGFILPPMASRVFFFTMGLLALGLGAGLLRLDNWARIGMNAVLVFGVVNMVALITPWGRTRLLAYNAHIYEQMHTPGMADRASALYTGPLIFFSAAFGLLVYGVVAWILYRYREAFRIIPVSNQESV